MLYILLFLCLIQLAAIIWLALQVQKLRNPQDDNALRTLRQEIAADTQNQMQMLGNLLSGRTAGTNGTEHGRTAAAV